MSQPYKVSAQENSDSLRQEAYTIIQRAFNIPQGFDNLSLNRLVDCIISAAVLQVAALQEKAAQPLRAVDLATDSHCPECNSRLTWCAECEKHITPSH